MADISRILRSTPSIHVCDTISDKALRYVPTEAKLHGMHKPYTCDFTANREKLNNLAENTFS